MILDSGICTIFRKENIALSGEMPRPGYTFIGRSWYGELNFESTPSRPTEGRTELRTDARIRINQNRNIRQNDIVVLADISDFNSLPDGTTIYDITRFYHGQDDDRPDLITDINLEVMEP